MTNITITTKFIEELEGKQKVYTNHLLLLISDYNEFRIGKGTFQIEKKKLNKEWDKWINQFRTNPIMN